jgi:hypothetical protein
MTGILRCTRPDCNNFSENIDLNPKAWSGWVIAPSNEIACPDCIAKELRAKGFEIRLGNDGGKRFVYLHFLGISQ